MIAFPLQQDEKAVRSELAWLARNWDGMPEARRKGDLRKLAHPSLAGTDLDQCWEDYRDILGILDGYTHGTADWHHFADCYEDAGDNIRGEAEYAVLDLIHGIKGHGGDAA